MKMISLLFVSTIALSGTAFAQSPAVSEAQFATAIPRGDEVVYSETIVQFGEWSAKSPLESQVLTLYPGYKEPNNARLQIVDRLMLYVARTKTLVNKPAAQVKLGILLDKKNIEQFDPDVHHHQISYDETIPVLIDRKQPITSFSWCSGIRRPKNEVSVELDGHKFCKPAERSVCIESCYDYPGVISKIFTVGSLLSKVSGKSKANKPKPDDGTASQSEIRYFTSEAEYGPQVPLAKITGVPTQVTGVVQQNVFYFNQLFQFGKLVSVLQPHPTDPSKSVITNFLVLAVHKRSWDDYNLEPVLMYGVEGLQNAAAGFSPTGILRGVPTYSQSMTKSIAGILAR